MHYLYVDDKSVNCQRIDQSSNDKQYTHSREVESETTHTILRQSDETMKLNKLALLSNSY